MALENRLGKIADAISTAAMTQDLNAKGVFEEIEGLKAELLAQAHANSYILDVDMHDDSVIELKRKIEETKKRISENKIKLRLFQQSLSLILHMKKSY